MDKKEILENKIIFLKLLRKNSYLIAADEDNDIIIIRINDKEKKQIGKIRLQYEEVQAAIIDFNEEVLALLEKNGTIHLYEIKNEDVVQIKTKKIKTRGDELYIDETGTYLCIIEDEGINNIWKIDENRLVELKVEKTDFIELMNRSSNKHIYYQNNKNSILVNSREIKFEVPLHTIPIEEDLISKYFIRRDVDDVNDAEENEEIKQYADYNYKLEVYNRQRDIVAACERKSSCIDIWKIIDGKYIFLQSLDKHTGIVKCITFSEDSRTMISGCYVGEVKVWRYENNEFHRFQTLNEPNHKDEISGIIINKDNNYILSLDRSKNLLIWKLHFEKQRRNKKKRKVQRYYCYYEEPNFKVGVHNIIFSDDNALLKLQIEDKEIVFFDLENKQHINEKEVQKFIYQEVEKKLSNKEEVKEEGFITQKNESNHDEKSKEYEKQEQELLDIDQKAEREGKKNYKDIFEEKRKQLKKLDKVLDEKDKQILEEIKEFRNSIFKTKSKKNVISNEPISTKKHERLDVYCGIDFGTSNTKIAYKKGNLSKKVEPIMFDHKLKGFENIFMPTVAAIDENNELLVGLEAAEFLEKNNIESGISNFKILFMNDIDDSICESNNNIQKMIESNNEYCRSNNITVAFKYHQIIIAFLAYVVRKIKTTIKQILNSEDLNFFFNVCIPVDFVNNNEILEEFNKLLAAAEFIEEKYFNKYNKIDFIEKVYKNIEYNDKKTRIFYVPETIAEILAYTNSNEVRDGLHTFIDFGAGTTDISILNIIRPKTPESKFEFFSSIIINKGFRYVDYFNLSDNKQAIWNYIKELWKDTHTAWHAAYLKRIGTDAWSDEKVQIFISGGGASSSYVKEIFSWPIGTEENKLDRHPLRILPMPESHKKKEETIPYHRFAVAYGLANDRVLMELQKYVLPKDVPVHEEKTKIVKKNYTGDTKVTPGFLKK